MTEASWTVTPTVLVIAALIIALGQATAFARKEPEGARGIAFAGMILVAFEVAGGVVLVAALLAMGWRLVP